MRIIRALPLALVVLAVACSGDVTGPAAQDGSSMLGSGTSLEPMQPLMSEDSTAAVADGGNTFGSGH